jgi:simple sugar transport system ATP-binding protein
MQLVSVSKQFSGVAALRDVSLTVRRAEVTCLLGDNGAGKSTLIKIMSGVYAPTTGQVKVDGRVTTLSNPREAQALGIAAVHQEDGTFPLMSVSRNFFLGHEVTKGWGPLSHIDKKRSNKLALSELSSLGIARVVDGDQLVGTLSGGERQALTIGRALYFGARLLILDEPTSALGVKEAGIVLRLVQEAKNTGVGIVFITHNAVHASSVGDRFTVLIHGEVAAEFGKGERSNADLLNLMAGGEELEALQEELEAK